MKTVSQINPEKEYENAKIIIEEAAKMQLSADKLGSLDSSVDNLITAARVLMDREERRRGKKQTPKSPKKKGGKKGAPREEVNKLPSKKFPHLEVKEETVEQDPPLCPCCNEVMRESQLFDVTEKLEFIPASYWIRRTKRPKFNCGKCHGSMINTPPPASIIQKSLYGDSFIINVALSKYCDLIPIERQVAIAARQGLEGLPAQSLIGLTHHLANFLEEVYLQIKTEVMESIVLHMDETTHNMLEGDETPNWYLWGYFCQHTCYMEAWNTRSGDVPKEFLLESKAEYILTDGYPGYGKAVREIKEDTEREIIEVHCNAHAIRYFKTAAEKWTDELEVILDQYKEIYELESSMKEKIEEENISHDEQLTIRKKMIPHFEKIKEECEVADPMPKSKWEESINYFLNHYAGLTVCTDNPNIPLDNNLAEREFRTPVVGRKTWYGTHSKRGARTNAILFSIVRSCMINGINPRNYFPWIVERILQGKTPLTPFEYSKLADSG